MSITELFYTAMFDIEKYSFLNCDIMKIYIFLYFIKLLNITEMTVREKDMGRKLL